MNFFRNRPPLRRQPPSNGLIDPELGGGLPPWASSANFRDFEEGADREPGVLLGGAVPNSVEGVLASQTADGVRDVRPAGVEEAGRVTQAVKPYIMRELEAGGFNDQEARALFEAADKIPDRFWVFHAGRMNTTVTPEDDRAYREQAQSAKIDEALRRKALEFYERQFAPGGRMRRVGRE